MKKKISVLLSSILFFTFPISLQASELLYDDYYTTANIEVGIDFTKFKIYDGEQFIQVIPSMVTNYDPNKLGRQLVTISNDEEAFTIPIFLTQQPSALMNPDGYVGSNESNLNTSGLTNTLPNTIIDLDVVTTAGAIVPCYTGADGREFHCYLYKVIPTGYKIWGNNYIEYYPKEIEIPLQDIQGAWYEQVCTKMYISNVMQGTSTTTFEPNSLITRAQACQILYKLAGCPVNVYSGHYKDVKRTDWFANAVQWYYTEILKEDRDYINPNFYISRDEVAYMITNCLDQNMLQVKTILPASFRDIDDCTHPDAVIKLQQMGIISGNSDLNFNPQSLITRAEFATIINNYIDVYIEGRS